MVQPSAFDALSVFQSGFNGEAFREQSQCPVCGSASKLFATPQIIDPDRPIPIEILQCIDCQHGWLSPIPAQAFLNHLYASADASVIRKEWAHEGAIELTLPEAEVAKQELQGKPGSYFELGVGKGSLYSLFQNAAWTCLGVEPGAWGRLPGVLNSIEDLPADTRFDVLVALDVLEHLERPIEFLKQMHRAAVPGARLYASFPNIDSFRARYGRAAWRMARPLGHVHYFSRKSVKLIMAQAGFRVTRATTNDIFRPSDLRRHPRTAVSGLIQMSGYGDQWFVTATPV